MYPRESHTWKESEEAILARGFSSGIPISELSRRHLRSASSLQEKLEELGWIQKIIGPDSSMSSADFRLSEYEPGNATTVKELLNFNEKLSLLAEEEERIQFALESIDYIPFDRDLDGEHYVHESASTIQSGDWSDTKDDFDPSDWEEYMGGNDDHDYDRE